ncbi:Uncharacterised protein [Raoultella planticola]|uniref:Uncharacterized protein n=1 Tax=Raoultella planticola TaxID=575 RepID=A0A485B713_RAOPL|nr:Uncharacterised protein [Raoultella planticola]
MAWTKSSASSLCLLQQYADFELAGVEIDPVAEDKQQQQRNDHRNQPAAGVTDDLPRLFDAQGRARVAMERILALTGILLIPVVDQGDKGLLHRGIGLLIICRQRF